MRVRTLLLGGLALATIGTEALPAATTLAELRSSPDVTAVLGGVAFADEAVAADDRTGGVVAVPLGPLSAEADVAAYHLLADGDHLLVFEATVTLPGPLVARPADVVRFDGASYWLELSGEAAGLPAGARIDALARLPDGRHLVSLDVAADLGGQAIDDSDLLALGGGPPALHLAAEAAGIPATLDVDAIHLLESGRLLVSFDTGGTVGGVAFGGEDVLELDPAGPSWELAYDGDAELEGWVGADLDALWALGGAPAPPPPAGEIRFTAAHFVTIETEAFAQIHVERLGGGEGAVGVSYFTADQTATAGQDYAAAAGSLNWGAGELGVRTFLVPILDDALVEGVERVRLVLTGPTGGAALGTPAVAELRITDDEAPTIAEIPALGPLGLALLVAALGLAAATTLRGR